MTIRRAALAVVLTIAALLSGGCATRAVDIPATGAEPIEGAGTLHVFCDRFGTLVYVTIQPGTDDDYEAFFAQACVPGTRPIVSTAQVPVAPRAVQIDPPSTWRPDGDLGNTQPGAGKGNS